MTLYPQNGDIFDASATYKTSNILIPKVVKFGFRAFTFGNKSKVL